MSNNEIIKIDNLWNDYNITKRGFQSFSSKINENIEELNLSFNKIETIENIEYIKNLEHLNLIGNPLKYSLLNKEQTDFIKLIELNTNFSIENLYNNFINKKTDSSKTLNLDLAIEKMNKEKEITITVLKERNETNNKRIEKVKEIKKEYIDNTKSNNDINFGY